MVFKIKKDKKRKFKYMTIYKWVADGDAEEEIIPRLIDTGYTKSEAKKLLDKVVKDFEKRTGK